MCVCVKEEGLNQTRRSHFGARVKEEEKRRDERKKETQSKKKKKKTSFDVLYTVYIRSQAIYVVRSTQSMYEYLLERGA